MAVYKKDVAVGQWGYKPITLKMLDLDSILFSPYAYEQGMVKVIGEDGLQITLGNVGDYMKSRGKKQTIKIEGIERLNRELYDAVNRASRGVLHDGPVSCHCFIAEQGSPSFPDHMDPDGVMIYVVEGTKLMVINNEQHWLRKGSTLTMKPNVVHRAENREGSIMLSIGFEKFLVEKLNA